MKSGRETERKIIIITVFIHPKNEMKERKKNGFIFLASASICHSSFIRAYSLNVLVFIPFYKYMHLFQPLANSIFFSLTLCPLQFFVALHFFLLRFMKIDMFLSQVYCSCRCTIIGMSFAFEYGNIYVYIHTNLGRSHSFTFTQK